MVSAPVAGIGHVDKRSCCCAAALQSERNCFTDKAVYVWLWINVTLLDESCPARHNVLVLLRESTIALKIVLKIYPYKI